MPPPRSPLRLAHASSRCRSTALATCATARLKPAPTSGFSALMPTNAAQLEMNHNSLHKSGADSPILLIPYMWIGDFVRCHTVIQLLRARFPNRPVDVLATANNAPLADYMPGLRKTIVADLPRQSLALTQQRALAERLKREGYGTALVMPRTWKSALAPFLAGIPERTGFVGEARFFLLTTFG